MSFKDQGPLAFAVIGALICCSVQNTVDWQQNAAYTENKDWLSPPT